MVVGDVLLDCDVSGRVTRLTPDSSAPVVEDATTRLRPGGAGLAAVLAARDGHAVELVAPVGRGPDADLLRVLLAAEGVEVTALPAAGGPVRKTRVRTGDGVLARVDTGGPGTPVAGDAAAATLDRVGRALRGAGAVLVSDYGLGCTALPGLRRLLEDRPPGVPLVWDPHPRGTAPVPGATVVTPNAAEARGADPGGAGPPAARLARRWATGAVAVTLGARGVDLASPHGVRRIPADPVPGDPCGAGDRFATSLALGLGAGADLAGAVRGAMADTARFLAAGGVGQVSGPGPATRPAALHGMPGGPGAALHLVASVRASGGTVVATGGCFDLLHAGHATLLAAARAQGDCLVVCLNSDESVRRLKGAGRPVTAAADRAVLLGALGAVDAVVVFEEDTPERVLARLRPDVWVKGGDYAAEDLPERALVESWGGRVVTVPVLAGRSTTALVRSLAGGGGP